MCKIENQKRQIKHWAQTICGVLVIIMLFAIMTPCDIYAATQTKSATGNKVFVGVDGDGIPTSWPVHFSFMLTYVTYTGYYKATKYDVCAYINPSHAGSYGNGWLTPSGSMETIDYSNTTNRSIMPTQHSSWSPATVIIPSTATLYHSASASINQNFYYEIEEDYTAYLYVNSCYVGNPNYEKVLTVAGPK